MMNMLMYAHQIHVPFYQKPELAVKHLRVVEHVRDLFRADVYACRDDTCGLCGYCFADKHQELGWKVFIEGTYTRSLKLELDCVPLPPHPVRYL